MSAPYLDAVATRRTYYAISPEPILSDDELKALLEKAVLHCPSAFNTQGGRIVLFLGEKSHKVWSIVSENYAPTVAAPALALMTEKIKGYTTGYGTVGFFEDQAVTKDISAKMPSMPLPIFELWSEQSNAMLQHIVWTTLTAEGYGASLQHHPYYEPNTLPALLKEFDLPETWKCTALMPFGKPTGGPGLPGRTKEYLPVETRVKVLG